MQVMLGVYADIQLAEHDADFRTNVLFLFHVKQQCVSHTYSLPLYCLTFWRLKMNKRVLFTLLCSFCGMISLAQGFIAVSGSVYPDPLNALSNSYVVIGYDEAWGSVTVDSTSHWTVGPQHFNVENNGKFTVEGIDTVVDVRLPGTALWVVDGSMLVQNGAIVNSDSSIHLGGTVDSQYEGNLTIARGNLLLGSYGCTLYNGQIMVSDEGVYEGRVLVYGSYPHQSANAVTVKESSTLRGVVDLYGGSLNVLSGGRILYGGTLSGYYASNEARVVKGNVTGAGSCWGNTGSVTHTISEGSELLISDGGSVTSAYMVVGEAGSPSMVHTARVDVTGNDSRVVVDGSGSEVSNAGWLRIGQYSPAYVDVNSGGFLSAGMIEVWPTSTLHLAGAGTMMTSAYTTVEGLFKLESNAVLNAGDFLTRDDGFIDADNATVNLKSLSLSSGGMNVRQSTLNTFNTYSGQSGKYNRMNVSDSEWNNEGQMNVGTYGHVAIELVAATQLNASNVTLGISLGTGTIAVIDGSIMNCTGPLVVGQRGRGRVSVESGGKVVAETCQVGIDALAGSRGDIYVRGSNSLFQCDTLVLGTNENAGLEITDGGTVTSRCPAFAVGSYTSTVLIAGANSLFTTTNNLPACSRTGSTFISITNGGALVSGAVSFRSTTAGVCRVSLVDSQSVWQAHGIMELNVCDMSIADGGLLQAETLRVYNGYSSGMSSLVLSNARCEVSENVQISGMMTIENGAFMSDSNAIVELYNEPAAMMVRGAGTIWTNSGLLSVSAQDESMPMIIEYGAKVYAQTIYVCADYGYSFGDITVQGADSLLQANGELHVGFENGEGDRSAAKRSSEWVTNTLLLAGANAAAATITVHDSGVLAGSGSVNGPVSNNGMVSPGTDILCASLQMASYTQTTNGILAIDVRGPTSLGYYDTLQSAGPVSLDGTLRIIVSEWTPDGTNDYQIISTSNTLQGTFQQIEVRGCDTGLVEYLGNGVVRIATTNNAKQDQTISFSNPGDQWITNTIQLTATASSALPVSYAASSLGTLSGSALSFVGAGSVTVTVTQAGNDVWNPARPVSQVFTVNKLLQTIDFDSIPEKTYGNSAFYLSAVASSGLSVSYTIADATVATNAGSMIYITGAGSCDVVASQTGSTNYAATDVTNTLTVLPKNLTVIGAAASNKVYDTTLSASLSGGSLTGVINSDDVTLENSATGTFASASVSNGIAVQSYMTLGGTRAGQYTLSQPALSANITPANQTITFPVINDICWERTVHLSATASSGLTVRFAVTNGPATITGTSLSFTATGRVYVVASQIGNNNWNAAPSVTNTITANEDCRTGINAILFLLNDNTVE